jgi:hypothetical protein
LRYTLGDSLKVFVISRVKVQCNDLIEELLFSRNLLQKLHAFQQDLGFQKQYLNLQITDLIAAEKLTLNQMKKLGYNVPTTLARQKKKGGKEKLRRVLDSVLAIVRMKALSKEWTGVVKQSQKLFFESPVRMVKSPQRIRRSEASIPGVKKYYDGGFFPVH